VSIVRNGDVGATVAGDTDGRRLRRESNRQAVVEALVALYADGHYQPSTAEVAERSGLSPRSVFRYFEDTDDLARAAVAHHLERARPLLPVDIAPDAPRADRIAELVRRRIGLWEVVGPSARVARMRAPVHEVLADELKRNRAAQRGQIARLFAPELDTVPAPAARRALAAADVLCSFESYDMLRHDQELSVDDVAITLTEALEAVLP
jgi:AcrR family transcriptional regulator